LFAIIELYILDWISLSAIEPEEKVQHHNYCMSHISSSVGHFLHPVFTTCAIIKR